MVIIVSRHHIAMTQRAFRRPLETTSRAWSLPAPPAPNHGQPSGPCEPLREYVGLDRNRHVDERADRRINIDVRIARLERYDQRIAAFVADNFRRCPVPPPANDRLDAKRITAQKLDGWSRPYVAMQRSRRDTVLAEHPSWINWFVL